MSLRSAIKKGDGREAVRLINLKGRPRIDINELDTEEQTPLMVAFRYNMPEIAKLLIERGVDINKKDWHGKTALMYAATVNVKNNYPVFKFLLEQKDLDKDHADAFGDTALMQVVKYDNPINLQIVNDLLDAGVDIFKTNNKRETAYDIAVKNRFVTATHIIKEHEKKLNKGNMSFVIAGSEQMQSLPTNIINNIAHSVGILGELEHDTAYHSIESRRERWLKTTINTISN